MKLNILKTAVVVAALLAASGACRAEDNAANVIEKRGGPVALLAGERKVDAGIEITSPVSNINGMYEMPDGRFAVFGDGRITFTQDGRNWTPLERLPVIHWPIRLNDGKQGGIKYGELPNPWHFLLSSDEWKTYETLGQINVGLVPGVPYSNALVQAKSGRIFLPVRFVAGAAHDGIYEEQRAWGTIKGKREPVEGHAQYPEPDNTFVYYSDDQGKTWQRSEGGIMIWHKNGFGGMWPCDEPCIVEMKNGDMMLYLRTSLGRVYTSRSRPARWKELWGENAGKEHSALPGTRWDLPMSTQLAGSYSPCKVKRIPKTGDLLIVWNQVSGDEVRAGYRRGRLSCAISKDDGRTWQHFRTLDRVALPPAGRVKPDPEPGMTRAFKYVGELPDDYGAVDYPDIGFWKDQVIITWYRVSRTPKPGEAQGQRMRIAPASWFYQDEPPYKPPKPAPAFFIQKGKSLREVSGLYCDERLFVNLRDVAKITGDKVTANMYAPIHQVLTYLGYQPTYKQVPAQGITAGKVIVTLGKRVPGK